MRIWTSAESGKYEFRKLDRVEKNDYGDICFFLDRGQRWQFIPRWECKKHRPHECNDDCRKCLNAQRDREEWPLPRPEEVESIGHGESSKSSKAARPSFWSVLILKNPERVYWGHLQIEEDRPSTSATRKPGAQPDADQIAALQAFARLSQKDAVHQLSAAHANLDVHTIHAGWLHVKGLTWAEMCRKADCSRGTLAKRVKTFYKATGWPRTDRRLGLGRKYRLDERRDASPE